VAINNVMPKINDYLQGFQNNLPGMKDFRHASRLYLDDNYKLMPKQKFLFHVIFQTDESLFEVPFGRHESLELNMLVKACDLPKYNMNMEEKFQYNKKMYCATRIQYDPINIVFHDDHADTVNAFWKKYYQYHIADSVQLGTGYGPTDTEMRTKDDYYDSVENWQTNKWGMDTPVKRRKPYLQKIIIFVLHKQRFTAMQLINPKIASFAHDNLDAADGAGIMANSMQVMYETVLYHSGVISKAMVPGFATIHYDHEPSPLTVLGGGTNSIFGPGGVVDGIGSVMKHIGNKNILGAILSASNTYNNAKKMKKKDVKTELKGLAKKGILDIGKQAGTITNPVGAFTIGAIGAGVAIASAKGIADNKNRANSTVISNPIINTTDFFTADEAYNLVTTDANVRDAIAAGIYYKDIGSRKGLTIAESDVEYTASTDTAKTVYRSKAITNIRKLVTEGYIKINRETQNVSIATEKAGL